MSSFTNFAIFHLSRKFCELEKSVCFSWPFKYVLLGETVQAVSSIHVKNLCRHAGDRQVMYRMLKG